MQVPKRERERVYGRILLQMDIGYFMMIDKHLVSTNVKVLYNFIKCCLI